MNKEEILQDLKRKIYYKIEDKEITEEEINRIVKQCFDGIEQIFEEYQCLNASISEYIDENYINSKNYVSNNMQNRSDELEEKVNKKIKEMIQEVEEKGKIENVSHKSELENINLEIDDSRNTTRIVDKIVDNLTDIRSQASRILYNRGYSDSRVEQIMENVNSYIRKVETSKAQDIYEILNQDGRNLAEDIVQKYEEIEQELTEVNNEIDQVPENEKETSENELNFRDGLSSGITLEEQAKNTEKIIEELEERKKQISENEKNFEGLRGDILE